MNVSVLSAGDKYSGRAKRTDAAATDANASQVWGLAAPSFKYRRRPLSNLSSALSYALPYPDREASKAKPYDSGYP
jgi:hypothetical protein